MLRLLKQKTSPFSISGNRKSNEDKNKINICMIYSSTWSQVITFICSFIVGLGDSSQNTQIMSILTTRYEEKQTASVFAIFKLVQVRIHFRIDWNIFYIRLSL